MLCLFLQRLATSVTMVAKGVLKEHLILLANSMTCAGNLVGFNSGGYKALSRSFNVQAPFAEATLFVSNMRLVYDSLMSFKCLGLSKLGSYS